MTRVNAKLQTRIPRIHTNDPRTDPSLMQFLTIRAISVFVAIVASAVSCAFSNAQESPLTQTPEVAATPDVTAQPNPSWSSPDKRWEYRSPSQDEAKIVKDRKSTRLNSSHQ